MSLLEFILPPTKPVAPGEGGGTAAPVANNQSNVPFDQVISRLLSPAQTKAAITQANPTPIKANPAQTEQPAMKAVALNQNATKADVAPANQSPTNPAVLNQMPAKASSPAQITPVTTTPGQEASAPADAEILDQAPTRAISARPNPTPANPKILNQNSAQLAAPQKKVQPRNAALEKMATNTAQPPALPVATKNSAIQASDSKESGDKKSNSPAPATPDSTPIVVIPAVVPLPICVPPIPTPAMQKPVAAESSSSPSSAVQPLVLAATTTKLEAATKSASTLSSRSSSATASNPAVANQPPSSGKPITQLAAEIKSLPEQPAVKTDLTASPAPITVPANQNPSADQTIAPLAMELKPLPEQPVTSTAEHAVAANASGGNAKPVVPLPDAPGKPDFAATGPPWPDAAAKPPEHPASNTSASPPDSNGAAITAASDDGSGISAAKLDTAMKNALKTNKVAGLAGKTEKVLPGNSVPVATTAAAVRTVSVGASSISANSPLTTGNEPAVAAGVANVTSSAVERTNTIERTQEIIASQSVRLASSGADSVQVVIKPEAGLQLSLEMRQRGNAIDAQVTVQHGDSSQLSKHWPELQQRLEQRGVRLADLGTNDGGNAGFGQPRQKFTDSESSAPGFIPGINLTTPAITTPATAPAPAITHRGWQSWA